MIKVAQVRRGRIRGRRGRPARCGGRNCRRRVLREKRLRLIGSICLFSWRTRRTLLRSGESEDACAPYHFLCFFSNSGQLYRQTFQLLSASRSSFQPRRLLHLLCFFLLHRNDIGQVIIFRVGRSVVVLCFWLSCTIS